MSNGGGAVKHPDLRAQIISIDMKARRAEFICDASIRLRESAIFILYALEMYTGSLGSFLLDFKRFYVYF